MLLYFLFADCLDLILFFKFCSFFLNLKCWLESLDVIQADSIHWPDCIILSEIFWLMDKLQTYGNTLLNWKQNLELRFQEFYYDELDKVFMSGYDEYLYTIFTNFCLNILIHYKNFVLLSRWNFENFSCDISVKSCVSLFQLCSSMGLKNSPW